METRIGYDYKGNKHSFKTDGEYFQPNSDTKGVFNNFPKSKAAIFYTKLVEDTGYLDTKKWGTPVIERYNNGIVGYQCINHYKTIEEAKKEFEKYKLLSPKIGIVAYVDIWLAINDKNK